MLFISFTILRRPYFAFSVAVWMEFLMIKMWWNMHFNKASTELLKNSSSFWN
jgi:hypothetical protein